MNKRLRKKKRVGKFTEYGFSVDMHYVDDFSEAESLAFLDDWVSVLESNGLCCGSGSNTKKLEGYVATEGRGTATEDHRRLIDEWLTSHSKVRQHSLGPLTDANR